MSRSRSPRGRPRRRRPVLRALLVTAGLVAAFGLGVALGQALETDSTPETAVTRTRTLVPIASETVTVTTTVTTP